MMITKQIDTCRRYTPVPLSLIIHAANAFDCDIYIKGAPDPVNVKCYDDMMCNQTAYGKSLLFFFNGADELAAQKKFEMIFQE